MSKLTKEKTKDDYQVISLCLNYVLAVRMFFACLHFLESSSPLVENLSVPTKYFHRFREYWFVGVFVRSLFNATIRFVSIEIFFHGTFREPEI